jgi:starch-binding outer membrane protein, SusD/RagB family
MRQFINKLFFSTILIIGLGACQDDFYDRKPYNALSVNDAIKNEADLVTAANGMYSGMRTANLFLRGIPFMGDILADNVYLSASNSNRYVAQYNYSYILTNGDTGGIWQGAYAVILRANNIINANVTETVTTKQIKGEALTVRALMYWELAKWFGQPITTNPTGLSVPIILTFDPTIKPGRNTTTEVYDQVAKDLNQAFDLMTVTNKNSSFISKYVAKALLAKVLLYRADYPGAKVAAQDVVTNGGYALAASTSAAYNAYWANAVPVTNKLETIFEISTDGVNNVGFDALSNMFDQNGYGDGLCTSELYNLYTATDVRRALLVSGSRAGENVFLINKYQNTRNNADKDDGKVLRYSDILLVLAEANARTNDEVNALRFLNQVVQRRDPSATALTSTGATLIEDIIRERRKELAFEGDRFPDLNRLGRPIVRNAQYPAAARNIPANNFRRIMPIPQFEIDANPAIKVQQNPEY